MGWAALLHPGQELFFFLAVMSFPSDAVIRIFIKSVQANEIKDI
jgi:hypothetical protein